MIKFLAADKKKRRAILCLGLSDENVRLLKEGRPILVNLDEMGIKISHNGRPYNGDIIIHHGETEEAILEQFKAAGLVFAPETKVGAEGGN